MRLVYFFLSIVLFAQTGLAAEISGAQQYYCSELLQARRRRWQKQRPIIVENFGLW